MKPLLTLAVAWLLLTAAVHAAGDDWQGLLAIGQLVDVTKAVPGIAVEMRYAGTDNLLHHPIYSADMPCMVRPQVARYLQSVQDILRPQGYSLKIWDAYRPAVAHRAIWQQFSKRHYVADPTDGRGSLHTWGLAVDVTLIDAKGREISMPSAFDDFTPAASGIYQGSDDVIHTHLRTLQIAMKAGGFIGLSTEWWHFAARNWKTYEPLRWEQRIRSTTPADLQKN